MSWQEKDIVSLRKEFVIQASKDGANISDLCRRYQISRKTGYKWLERHRSGFEDLNDFSKRPHHNPVQLKEDLIEKIIDVREKHPHWGARKIQAVLKRKYSAPAPAKSTIHNILKKYGYVNKTKSMNNRFQRFEHEAPNHLWQMDFKGHFEYEKGRCHPLTILDDHSRYSIKLIACPDEKGETIKPILIDAFRHYGLPDRINVDNGNPWGSSCEHTKYTIFSIWLIRLGIKISHSRPAHPQTNGKDERFHRTLNLEVIDKNYFKNLEQIQKIFDAWRHTYNLDRPHEGIQMQVPADRYRPSYRNYPEISPVVEYADDCVIRKVDDRGRVHIYGRQIFVGSSFAKEFLGLRHQAHSDVIKIYYCHQMLGEVDLHLINKKTMVNLYSGKIFQLG